MGKIKRFSKKNWKAWGVEGLISEGVLKRMVATGRFDVNFAYESARCHLERVLWQHILREVPGFHPADYKEIQKIFLAQSIANLNPDPAKDDIFRLGRILERAFVVKMIEGVVGCQGQDSCPPYEIFPGLRMANNSPPADTMVK
jgi:hypothetical protein